MLIPAMTNNLHLPKALKRLLSLHQPELIERQFGFTRSVTNDAKYSSPAPLRRPPSLCTPPQ